MSMPDNIIKKIVSALCWGRWVYFRSKTGVLINDCDPIWVWRFWIITQRYGSVTVMQKNPQNMRQNVLHLGCSCGSSSVGCRGRTWVHSCSVDPGSSLVSVCQRSTFLPLFFRQSIQCCRVSPCEWHPKDTPPNQSRDGTDCQSRLM